MSTKNIVPRTTHQGQLGRVDKVWSAIHVDDANVDTLDAQTGVTTGTLTATGNTSLANVSASGNVQVTGSVSGANGSFTGSVSGGSGNFSGNLTVGGTLNLQGTQQFFFLALSRLKAYSVGDIAFPASAPSWVRLECVQTGTTSVTEPEDYADIESAGETITDGTVRFIVDDMRDNSSVGDVVFRPFTKTGYLACNGQTVNRADYPRLVSFVTSNSLWTSNQTNEPWKFGNGNGSTTMTVPNYLARVVQGGSTTAKLEAGLPNITGSTRTYTIYPYGQDSAMTGSFYLSSPGGTNIANQSTVSGGLDCAVSFNANRSSPIYGSSSTVQPPAIQLIPQIKY